MITDKTYKGPDRRQARRVRADFIVIYKIMKAPWEFIMRIGNKEINALMLDLSELGIAIETEYDIPVSTSLLIKFILINLTTEKDERFRPMDIIGEVRHKRLSKRIRGFRIGIAFTQISEEDKAAIANFVKMSRYP